MTTNGYDSFSSMNAAKAAFNNSGSHWFSAGAMRFFNSNIETDIIEGVYFITSERMEKTSDYPKRFSIRKIVRTDGNTPALDVETIGDFQQYETKAQALKALKELLA